MAERTSAKNQRGVAGLIGEDYLQGLFELKRVGTQQAHQADHDQIDGDDIV